MSLLFVKMSLIEAINEQIRQVDSKTEEMQKRMPKNNHDGITQQMKHTKEEAERLSAGKTVELRACLHKRNVV